MASHISLRPISRRVFGATSVILAAGLLVTGCSRSAATTGGSSTTTVDTKAATGTVTLWAPDGDATKLDTVLKDWKAKNPDLTLKVTLIPAAQYTTKLQTAISAGTTPDIAQVYTESQGAFLQSNALAAVPDGLVDEDSFFKSAWDAGTIDGTTYTVPWYAYTRVLIYRKDLAAKADATAPTTWDQMLPFLQALQSAGAQKGLGADVGWDTYNGQDLAVFGLQSGASLTNSDQTKWTLNSPEMIKAAEFNGSFYTQKYASVDSPTFLDVQPYLVSGKTGSIISGPWNLGAFDTVAKEKGWTAKHIGTAVLPKGAASNVGALGGGSWAVFKKSKNAASAWKVIRQLAQPASQLAQYEAYGSGPAVKAAWKQEPISSNALLTPFYDQLESTTTFPALSTWDQVSTLLGKEMEAVARGTETPKQALNRVQQQADSIGTGK